MPAGAELRLPQLAPYVTPNGDFYRIDTALVVPQVDPAHWQLRIHGRVRNPITLTYAELLARPMVERYVTLACVSNEVGGDLIGNARWLGVPLKDLLDEAEPLDGADQVVGRSVDGWTCGTPTAVLRDGRDAMLAVGMNGEPLPVEHGFPVRVVVPGLYGYVSACKWVVELELTSFADFDAYWVPRGWSAQAPIKTQSRIDTPRGATTCRRARSPSPGSPGRSTAGIQRVEVRVDDGPWQAATLAAGGLDRHLAAVVLAVGRDRRASTRCGCGPPTRPARRRPSSRRTGRAGRRDRLAHRRGRPWPVSVDARGRAWTARHVPGRS